MKPGDLCIIYSTSSFRSLYTEGGAKGIMHGGDIDRGALAILIEGPKLILKFQFKNLMHVRILTHKGVFWVYEDAIIQI